MRFDAATGDYCAGVQGDGGVVSLNGHAVVGPSAQIGGWFGDRIVCQYYGPVPPQILAYPGGEVLAERGASILRSNGLVWAAHLEGFGLFSSTGFGGAALYLADVGPDGAIAFTPHAGFPVRVVERNGTTWTLTERPTLNVQLLGDGRAVYQTYDGRWHGIAIDRLPHPADSLRIVGEWCAYQYRDQSGGPAVVIRRISDGSQGWTIPAPLAYGIDLCILGDIVRVGFARGAGEQPGDFTVRDFPMSAAMQLLGGPPVVIPPSHPEPETPMPVAPNVFQRVQEVFAAHPEINTMEEGTRGRMTDYVVIALGGRPWGRKDRDRDPNNNNSSDDALCYLLPDGRFEIYDIINGATGGPSWDYKGTFADGENGYFRDVIAPTPGPGPAPLPMPPAGSIDALVAAAIAAAVAPLKSGVSALEQRVRELEAAPAPVPAPGFPDRITLRSVHGKYFTAEPDGRVVADRAAIGSWEVFDIEPQA